MDLFRSIFDILIKIRSKNDWNKDQNNWLKDPKSQFILKNSIYIENVNIFWLFRSLSIYFDHFSISFRSLFDLFTISFWSLLIDFDLFDIIWTRLNRFCHDNWFGFQDFRSKKSIKRLFDHDISQFVNLDRLDLLSLQMSDPDSQKLE